MKIETPEQAITRLNEYQSQIICGPTVFSEIANVISNLKADAEAAKQAYEAHCRVSKEDTNLLEEKLRKAEQEVELVYKERDERRRERDQARKELEAAKERVKILQLRCLSVRDASHNFRSKLDQRSEDDLERAVNLCNSPDLLEGLEGWLPEALLTERDQWRDAARELGAWIRGHLNLAGFAAQKKAEAVLAALAKLEAME